METTTPAVGDEGRILTSGVDSLYLSVDLIWRDGKFFQTLAGLKTDAAANKCPMPGYLEGEGFDWTFGVVEYGLKGYEWVLGSAEYVVMLGNWMSPQSRPSALIEIRSETLWLYGVVESIDRILTLLTSAGGMVKTTKASRIDLCTDILLPETLWNFELARHRVTRAQNFALHGKASSFTGFTIGQGGSLSARLYDKEKEIAQKSKKFWMYDLWQIPSVPEGCKAIRVEFQLRREAITELGMDSIWSFTNHPRGQRQT